MPKEFIIPNQDDIDFAFEKVQNFRIEKIGKDYRQLFMEI